MFLALGGKALAALPLGNLDLCSTPLCVGLSPGSVVIRLNHSSVQPWDIKTCSCTSTFLECDPDAQVGAPDACTMAAPLQFVPLEIQTGQDPGSWVCYTQGNQRRCYCRDSNQSMAGCQ
jgi:hypothetical protein